MQRRETKVLMSRPSGAARLSGAVWLALQLPLLLLSESTGNPSLICRVSEVSARLLSRQPQTGTPFLSKDKMIKKKTPRPEVLLLICFVMQVKWWKYESFKTFSIYLYWSKVFISQPTYCSVSVVECQITEANSSEKCVLTCILACAKTNNIFLQKKAQNKSLHSLASLFLRRAVLPLTNKLNRKARLFRSVLISSLLMHENELFGSSAKRLTTKNKTHWLHSAEH